jgi:6,7-dimethyl-8-ribityllumazine synthase
MIARKTRILILESRYYTAIADVLADGAIEAVRASGAEWDVISLPGILELAPAIAMADDSNRRPAGRAYDGYVALGCVLRDKVLSAGRLVDVASHGLMTLATSRRLAIGQGLIDVASEADGLRWAKEADGGGNAARACLELVALQRRLLGSA